ncbi:peptide ABC transporter permease [Xaviernesmea oryzae]|uniref:Peptide ABC transporter permease n=1 Tax=Xaviernesmea oryzae TaxID=464029 RepID=A0A1Q9B201_9HYPH|nr:ABC transporter permease [Xaviernesmea oryzae]OLP62023.1 peptide ABC transporter permease [Xaviernesmea oryzae]SEK96594.1 peptide/nickel transport system permease protein [Xaviernesmea oryzae]
MTIPLSTSTFAQSRRLPKVSLPPVGASLAMLFLIVLIAASIWPDLFATSNPLKIAPRLAFRPPGLGHPFGTDQSGRDIYSRVIYGAGQSLLLGVGAVAVSMALAIPLGLIGGLGGRLAERFIGWVLDVLFSFPTLILALLFAAHLGGGIGPLIVATGVGNAPGYGRMIFGQTLSVRRAGYIEAARMLGHSPLRIIWRQILPNVMRPLIVMVTMGIGQAIVWSSALSFLGLGAQPPAAEWGTMLAMGRDFVSRAWWLTVFPGLFIVLTTLSTTVVGRYLQRCLEGRTS